MISSEQKYELKQLPGKKSSFHGGTAGDIDNDGDVDVVTTDFSGAICHFNDGIGNFKAKKCTGNTTFTVTLGDFNNDGNLDMVTGNAHYNQVYRKYSQQGNVVTETPKSHNISLYHGNGKGKFKKIQTLEPAKVKKFIFSEVPEMTSFDFDNDGDLDVISSVVGMYYSGSAWGAYENKNGKLPKVATIVQAKDENRKVCLKFNLNSFSRLANINNTPIKIVTNDAEIKLWLSSLKIIWSTYGPNIAAPKTISNIPIKKNTVLFVAIKIEII